MASPGNVLRANLRGVFQSTDVWNMVFHYSVISGTDDDYESIADDIELQMSEAFANVEDDISDDVTTSDMDLSEWDTAEEEFDGKATVASAALTGAEVATMLPNGVSVVMRFITQELRRQGRKFLPGITDQDNDQNAVSASLLVSTALCAGVLNNSFTAGALSLTPCTFNSTVGSVRFGTLSLFTNTFFVNSLVGYQRGRQPGAGA